MRFLACAVMSVALACGGGGDDGPIDAPGANVAPMIVSEPGPTATEDLPYVYRPGPSPRGRR